VSPCGLPSLLTGVTGRVSRLCGQRKSKFKTESIIFVTSELI